MYEMSRKNVPKKLGLRSSLTLTTITEGFISLKEVENTEINAKDISSLLNGIAISKWASLIGNVMAIYYCLKENVILFLSLA